MPSVRSRLIGDITTVLAVAALGLGVWLTATRQKVMRDEIRRNEETKWTTDDSTKWVEEFRRLNPGTAVPNPLDVKQEVEERKQ